MVDADELRLWLIRHAPVAGPREVIHPPDAPADVGDDAALSALDRLSSQYWARQPVEFRRL